MHLRVLGSLVGRIDAREALDFAFASFLVQALRVTCLDFFQRCINEHFHEGQGRVHVDLACVISVCLVWRYETSDNDSASLS